MEGIQVLVSVLKSGEPCFTIEVTQFPFTIGASARCDIVLDDPYVSRRHAVVTLSRGRLHFADTSTNGSFYAGRRIATRLLDSGDTVAVPPFELRFDYTFARTEERRTALRDLGEMLSPEVRQRLHDEATQRAAADASAPPDADEPEEPRPPTAPNPVQAVPPEEVPGPEAMRCEPGAVFEPCPAPSSPELPEQGAVEAAIEAPEGEDEPAAPHPAATASPTDQPVGPTAITPPPPPVPSHRSAASLREQDTPAAPTPVSEPPTIAFAAVRARRPREEPEPPAAEGTVHLPMNELMSGLRARLEVVDGPPEMVGKVFPLPDREITLGRSEQADLRLDLGNVSRVHASLAPHGEEEWLLRDLASLNGTFVAGHRITKSTIRPGQEFRLANAVALRLTRADSLPATAP